jgi:hypothetical protein
MQIMKGKKIIQDRTILRGCTYFAPNLLPLMTNRDFQNYSSLLNYGNQR